MRRQTASINERIEDDLSELKRLSHVHIVRLICTYATLEYIGIISAPAADYSLLEYLEDDSVISDRNSMIHTFFGCLASAVCYLHDQKILLHNITLENTMVKVKGSQVVLDHMNFGGTFLVSDTDGSPVLLKYAAPEVLAQQVRNFKTDIWGLGCVFLGIWIVLNGGSLSAFNADVIQSGGPPFSWSAKLPKIENWCSQLALTNSAGDTHLNGSNKC